jgi:hypothetical protein
MKCAHCTFAHAITGLIECRRNSPQVLVDDEGEHVRAWPPVEPNDWCHKFRRRNASVDVK